MEASTTVWSERGIAGLGFGIGVATATLFIALAIPVGFLSNVKVGTAYERNSEKFIWKVTRSTVASIPVCGAIGAGLSLAMLRRWRTGLALGGVSIAYALLMFNFGFQRIFSGALFLDIALIAFLQCVGIAVMTSLRTKVRHHEVSSWSWLLMILFATQLVLSGFVFSFHPKALIFTTKSRLPRDYP